jgi:hypothetical protein
MSFFVFPFFFFFFGVSIKNCLNFACLIVSLATEVAFRKVLPFKNNNNVAFVVAFGLFRDSSLWFSMLSCMLRGVSGWLVMDACFNFQRWCVHPINLSIILFFFPPSLLESICSYHPILFQFFWYFLVFFFFKGGVSICLFGLWYRCLTSLTPMATFGFL